MAYRYFFSEVVLVITAALLFYAAFTDFKQYKIRNDLVLTLVGLFAIHAVISGRWVNISWDIRTCRRRIFIFALFLRAKLDGRRRRQDVDGRLFVDRHRLRHPVRTSLARFFKPSHAGCEAGWLGTHGLNEEARTRIPFAPSLAAALISMFIIGCLRPEL